MKRYAFSLLELMISLTLATLVLGFVFSSLYQNAHLKTKLEKGSQVAMERAEIKQRLSHIFGSISKEGKGAFYKGKNQSLHFRFDNGIDPDRKFCKIVSGSLEVKGGNFILKVLGDQTERESILCSNVNAVEYEFLYSDGEKMLSKDTWGKKAETLPLFFKLTLNDLTFVFWINHAGAEVPLT